MLTHPLLNIISSLRKAKSAQQAAQALVNGVAYIHSTAFLYYDDRWFTAPDTPLDSNLASVVTDLASYNMPHEEDEYLYVPIQGDSKQTVGVFVTISTPDNALIVLLVELFAQIAMVAEQKQTDALFRQTIDKANVPIDIHNLDGTLIYRNAAWNTLFGVETAQSIQFVDRLREQERALPETQIYPNVESSSGWADFVTVVSEDGIERETRMSVVALRGTNDEIVGYCTFTD
ncbi:MAG: hypothetical protein AAF126_17070, partial [Chloroflexota bacterium]